MIKTILVGLDGSEHARTAVRYGLWLGQRFDATVIGLHVVDIVSIEGSFFHDISGSLGFEPYLDFSSKMREVLHERGRALLQEFADRAAESGVRFDTVLGMGVVANEIAEHAKNKPDDEFTFFHRVRPRKDADPEALDERSLAFESVYVAEIGKHVIETGGYPTMPYAVSRYDQAPGEVYGRSPAMQAFPAIRTLMAQKRVVLTQGHRAVNPIILTADDGALDVSLRPGAIIGSAVSQDGRPLVQTMPVGDVNLGRDMMEDERLVINDTFLVSLFQILVETPDRMTATQVLERAQEKGQLLAPTVGQQHDYLGHVINREIDILARQKLIPPLPDELREAQGEYTIQYDNPVTRSSRAGEVAGLFRMLESVLPVINITGDPAPLDHVDWDVATREIAEISSVPVRWLKTIDQVSEIRQGRAEQQQQAMAAQAAPGQAALIRAAADAKTKGLKAEDLQ